MSQQLLPEGAFNYALKDHLPGSPACTLLAVGEGQASSSLEEEAHRILSSATNHC